MPKNPSRASQGGDVPGTSRTDVVLGEPLDVATASYEPGYDLDTTLENGHVNRADLKQGFCDYGVAVGEAADYRASRK